MNDRIRKGFRLSPEDEAWLAEHAEDEGVDASTLVSMIISRLRKGRPPLVSMMVEKIAAGTIVAARDVNYPIEQRTVEHAQGGEVIDSDIVEDVLASRLAEADGSQVVQLHSDEEAVAIPLRRVGREQYNPGRR